MKTLRSSLFSLLALALFSANAFAQTRLVSGRVTVEGSGEPIVAASVNVVGTTLGAYTDDQGRFTVSVPGAPATLRIRRIGYAQKVVDVPAGATELNVSLARDVLQLETQVVTGQATSVSSRNIANAVTVVSGDKLNRAPAQALDQALQGKVPGAVITSNSGAPGGGTQIQLRGVTSINANSSPLYVIDGIVVNNSAIQNGLNAISGAAGGNFSSNQDQQVNRIADINPQDIETIEVLKGASAGAIYGSRGSNGVIVITTKRGTAGKPVVSFTQRLGTQSISKKLGSRCFGSAAEVDAAGFDSTGFGAATVKCHDYEQELYGRKDLSYDTDMSVRGGTATGGTTYFVAGTVRHDAGIQVNTQYNKQSLRANLTQLVGSALTFRVNSELLHTLTERGLSGNDNNGVAPYTIISATPSFFDFNPNAQGIYSPNPYLPVQSNLLQDAALIRTPENVYRLLGSAAADWNVFATQKQSLTFSLLGGVDAYADQSKVYSPPQLFFEPLDDGLPGTVVNSQGNVVTANLNGTLIHKLFASAFTATTSVGVRQGRQNLQTTTTTGRGLPPGITDVSSALQTFNNEFQQIDKSLSYFGQEEFLTLGEKLLLTAGVNAERSSNNGDDRKFYAYPKFSASYNVPYLPAHADNLKLRVAYGRAGNLPPYGFKYTALVTSTDDNVLGGRPSLILGLPSIHPETSTELEGGFDLAFLNSRAQLSVTQYQKKITDLILSAALAPTTGYATKIIQSGNALVNNGTEVGLNLNVLQSDRLNWVSNTTFSRNRGKVTALAVPAFLTGGAFSTVYGSGRIEDGKSPTQVYVQIGCNIPLTASGRCNSKKYGAYGDFQPDYQMGFGNDFDFGPVRFTSLLDWRKGGKVINLTNNYFDGGLLADTAVGNARLKAFRGGQPVYAENGTFVKLREITVSYGLPKNLANNLFHGQAQDVRLEFSGRNVKTWTNYTGLDPEVSNFGNQNIRQAQDVTPFPPSRQFFFSVLANF
ncbi:MAG TPA: SusC/RagA family TonB-linked outer membrane protein [Gemmatimonadaceae bacterium]|nr:SusC/RagA family TonB-linked outer membrane protein [Gemmatimonadaceae bacterium]